MGKVFIVTDSTADIPQSLIEELNITVIPLKVHFGEETYLDGVTIKSKEFYDRLATTDKLPTTSQPSPMDFVNLYKNLANGEENVHIISIHLSSAMSGTYQSAALAKDMLEGSINVSVIDSRKASYAIGIIVVKVAEAVKAGKSVDACLELTNYLIDHTQVYFLVDTLQYLQKGGRIGKASAMLGSLLNIKPILSIDEMGEVYAKEKARGSKKALARIIDLLKEDAKDYTSYRLGVSHSEAHVEAEAVVAQLKQEFGVDAIVSTNIGSVIGTHVGPGTISITLSGDDFEI